jgi:hypothetical protein
MTSYDDFRYYFTQYAPRHFYLNCPEYLDIPPETRKYFDLHDDLWTGQDSLNFNGQQYLIKSATTYSSVRIPNKNNKKFLWITQNLAKSTSATYEITQAFKKGVLTRYTWIVDDTAGWNYTGLIRDIIHPKGDQKNHYDFELYNKQYQNIIYSNFRRNEFDKDFFEKPIKIEKI